jgi:hypothetical protein
MALWSPLPPSRIRRNAALLNYFGLPTNVPYAGNMNLSFSVAGGVTNGAAFRSTQVLSGDLTNTVPEPASMLLLGRAWRQWACGA